MSDHAPNSERLQRGLDLAITLHGHDARKGSAVPVLVHILGVCGIVQYHGGDEDEAIAALLHDALEDKAELITRKDIVREFGERVATIVSIATDTEPGYSGGDKGEWRPRKERYLAGIRVAPPVLLRVTLADKVDNLRSMLADLHIHGEIFWTRFSAGAEEQLWYYRSALEAYRTAKFPEGPLLGELSRLVGELEKAVAG